MPNFRPLGSYVLIQRVASETVTAGGIQIPDVAIDKPTEGVVAAVGPGDKEYPEMTLKAGDLVMFGRYDGSEVKIDGDEYVVIKEANVLGIIDLE